jgi:hypothetical protein
MAAVPLTGLPAALRPEETVLRFFGKGIMASKKVHRGSIDSVPPSTLIADIFAGRFTGILTLEQGERKKSLYIRNGVVTFATSTDETDLLGQVLLQGNRISEEKIVAALAIQQNREKQGEQLLGKILVKEGLIEPLDLVWAVTAQVEGIFCDCFHWSEGEFVFAEEHDPDSWGVITLDLSMPDLLRKALGHLEDPNALARLVGDFSQRIDVSAQWEELAQQFKLATRELDLLNRVRNGSDTMAGLILSSPSSAAEAARGILLLKSLGVITLEPA